MAANPLPTALDADSLDTLPSADEGKSDAQIASTLSDFLRRYQPPPPASNRDMLQKRYRIDLSTPLPEFNTKNAQAFAATDTLEEGKSLYALVCKPGSIQRHHAIPHLKSLASPYVLTPIAAEAVSLSQPQEDRFVILYERPAGKRLSDLLAANREKLSNYFIIKHIVAPLAEIIHQMSEMGVPHGRINVENVYFADIPVLGDCVSEPCGYSQIFYYESLERLQALPAGKGEGDSSQDYYALAVLVLNITLGLDHFSNLTPDSLIRFILRDGAYSALMRNKEGSESFDDFYRGVLVQNTTDRWGWRHIKPWLDGKHYNVLMPPTPSEGGRPFEYHSPEVNIQAHTRRELAHLLFLNWSRIPDILENSQLIYWLTVALRNKSYVEQVSRIARTLAQIDPKHDVQINEQQMRLLVLFDPSGPIRLSGLSLHIDGLDALCAELFTQKADKELQLLVRFIEYDMVSYWKDQQSADRDWSDPNAVNNMLQKLEKLRVTIRNAGLGFGIERLLYELNPDLPCQSPLLAGSHISTLPDLLRALDKKAPTLTADQEPIDRHIAAFIAHKLAIQHEIRVHELTAIPSLAANRSIAALKLLAMAQQKAGHISLPGLTHLLGLRILPALEVLRSKTLKAMLKSLLLERSQSGYLVLLSEALVGNNYASADQSGFTKACNTFQANATKLKEYKKGDMIDQDSDVVGFVFAKIFAYSALLITLVAVLRSGAL